MFELFTFSFVGVVWMLLFFFFLNWKKGAQYVQPDNSHAVTASIALVPRSCIAHHSLGKRYSPLPLPLSFQLFPIHYGPRSLLLGRLPPKMHQEPLRDVRRGIEGCASRRARPTDVPERAAKAAAQH